MEPNAFNMEELHNTQYGILLEFDRVCKKHNLKYFLGFGSMLGAIRHEGFIPWDDDIDVLMFYEDFEKLKKISANEWNDGFFLQSPETDKEYNRCFVKIRNSNTTLIVDDLADRDINHGVAIDVEPLVSLADNKLARKKQYIDTQLYMLFRVGVPPLNHGKLLYILGRFILTIISNTTKRKLINYFLNRVLLYEGQNTEYLYVVNGNVELMRDLHKRRLFDQIVMKKFEKDLFPIPQGYDEWLTTRYGDYMKLPPDDEQGIKLDHFIKIDLLRSYEYYKGKYYCK